MQLDKVLDEWIGHFKRRHPQWNDPLRFASMFETSLLTKELLMMLPSLRRLLLATPDSELVRAENIPQLSFLVEDMSSILSLTEERAGGGV